MRFYLLTLFPDFFSGPLSSSILARAAKKGLLDFQVINLRDYAVGRHKVSDDIPYGGGAGMVLKPEPFYRALAELSKKIKGRRRVIMLTPQGRLFDQKAAQRLAKIANLVFLCGHYEGVDERVRDLVDEEISVGDYVLSGGESAALVMIEAIARLKKGVLGNSQSAAHDSLEQNLLEGPQYTRPADFTGQVVPQILRGGHHQEIKNWRTKASLRKTLFCRPDLLARADLTSGQKEIIKDILTEEE